MIKDELQARGKILDDGVLQRGVAEARPVLAPLDVKRVLLEDHRVEPDSDGGVDARALFADGRGAQHQFVRHPLDVDGALYCPARGPLIGHEAASSGFHAPSTRTITLPSGRGNRAPGRSEPMRYVPHLHRPRPLNTRAREQCGHFKT